MLERDADAKAVVEEAERFLTENQPEAEAKVWAERQWRKQWQEEEKSREYREARELSDKLQQLLAKRAQTLQGQLIPETTYSAAELIMRAVGDLLENPIEISSDPDLEFLRQQEEPTGSRTYFVRRIAGALKRLGLPGTALERNAEGENLI